MATRFAPNVGAVGTAILSLAGTTYKIYTDAAATTLANITDTSYVAINQTTSPLALDSTSMLPEFYGPDDDSALLYARKADGTGPIWECYARHGDLFDTANVWTAIQTFGASGANGGSIWNTISQGQLDVSATDGLNGPALQLLALGAGKSANLLLVPDDTGNQSQILLYGKSGNDYNRIGFSNTSGLEFIIDSTYNGAGVARPIIFIMGGSVSNAIDGEIALRLYNDASVDLNGSNFTRQGKTWGSGRTRIADNRDSGDVRLIFDTRTRTPADNAADTAGIEFMRGGVRKWQVGLNQNGDNADSFDFFARVSGVNRNMLQVRATAADGETALLVSRNIGGIYTLQRVSMGAADSGGTGFKVLRIPN